VSRYRRACTGVCGSHSRSHGTLQHTSLARGRFHLQLYEPGARVQADEEVAETSKKLEELQGTTLGDGLLYSAPPLSFSTLRERVCTRSERRRHRGLRRPQEEEKESSSGGCGAHGLLVPAVCGSKGSWHEWSLGAERTGESAR